MEAAGGGFTALFRHLEAEVFEIKGYGRSDNGISEAVIGSLQGLLDSCPCSRIHSAASRLYTILPPTIV